MTSEERSQTVGFWLIVLGSAMLNTSHYTRCHVILDHVRVYLPHGTMLSKVVDRIWGCQKSDSASKVAKTAQLGKNECFIIGLLITALLHKII